MNRLKKFLAASVLFSTVLTMVGATTINVAGAAMDGDLIKSKGSSTVLYIKGGKAFVFPNETTYASWYSDNNGGPDWSGIKVVSDNEYNSYPLGPNVTIRPGTKLVKKPTTDMTVYAVEPNGTLRSIVSGENAADLWGPAWAKNIVDVPLSFFSGYTVGSPLTTGVYPAGSVVNPANSSDLYYWDGANYRKFSNESAFLANGFNFSHVVSTGKSVVANGSAITGAESMLMNTAGGASTGSNTPVGGSGLTVALASNTPVAANIPQSAVQVPFTSFNVTAANDGAVVIRSLTVTRGGLGASTNFSGVYLYDGNTRLTTSRTVNSTSNKATFTGLNYTVPAGQTRTLTVKADMASTVNNNFFAINAASDIDASGAVVSGSFPMMGNTMVGVAQSVGTITIEKSGSNPLTSPKAGETGAKVAEFKLTMGSEDGTVNALTLYQVGNIANDKLTNFMLKQSGTTLATTASMSGSNVIFNLATPYAMEKNTTKVFEVYADVNSTARSADTIRFYLDNNADLYAMGKTYGFGLAVDRDNTNGYDNVTADGTDASWSSIEAGQVTISQKGPAVTDYAVQQQDVELLRFDMASQINGEVRSTGITLTAGGTDADEDTTDTGGLVTNGTSVNYTDVKIVDVATGAIVAGPQDLTGVAAGNDDAQTLTFTDIWNIQAGKTRTLKVTADIANFTPHSTETIKATLTAFGSSAIKNLDTNLFVSSSEIVPAGTVIGAAHNVKSGSLTTTLAATPSLQTYINGTSNVPMVGINLTAGTGKDTKITSLKTTITGADSCATEADCVSSAMLYDGDTLLSTKNISGTTVTFSGLNTTIAKGTTKTLTIKTNLIKLSSVGGSTTLSFGIASASDISAQDMEGNNVDPSGTITGPAHVIASAGSMTGTLAADDATTESQIILAGASNVVLAKYRLTAASESLKLTKLRITLPANTAEEISTLALYDGATKLTNDVAVTNDTTPYADFNSFIADFIVPKDASKTLTVKGSTGTTSNGATSGTSITATLDYDTNFEARGINGSDTVDTALGSANIDGRAMIFRKAKLTFTEQALSSTAISNGSENEVYKFAVTADGNDAALKQLVFDVTLTENGTNNGLTAGSFKLFKGSTDITSLVDIHNIAGATLESSNTVGTTSVNKVIVTWASEDLIAAGETNPYTLRATLNNYGTGADDDSIRVILNADTAATTSGFNKLVDLDQTASQGTVALGTGVVTAGSSYHDGTAAATPTISSTKGNIIWSDYAVVAHDSTLADKTGDAGDDTVAVSTSSADWANGYLLKSLPFAGRTMNN